MDGQQTNALATALSAQGQESSMPIMNKHVTTMIDRTRREVALRQIVVEGEKYVGQIAARAARDVVLTTYEQAVSGHRAMLGMRNAVQDAEEVAVVTELYQQFGADLVHAERSIGRGAAEIIGGIAAMPLYPERRVRPQSFLDRIFGRAQED